MKRTATILCVSVLCGAGAWVPAVASADTRVINFDDFTAPSLFASTSPLTTRYEAQGATFSGPAPGKGGAVLTASTFSVTGNSGANILGFNTTTYGIGPETITFASPASSVSLNVGDLNAGTITLEAFNGGTVVATSSRAAANALGPLAVSATQITGVRLSFTGTRLVADDLQWTLVPPAASPLLPSGAAPVDKTQPALGSFTFSTSVFKAASSGSAFSAQRKRKKKSAPTGTKVSFNLSEASAVKFTVQRKTSGRRVSGKCKTRTRRNRRKPKCTLWKNVTGSFTVAGKAGKNSFTFRGRIGGKKLRTGSYRLNGTATDPSKNASVPKQKAFRIVK